jgi:hypothetical protein
MINIQIKKSPEISGLGIYAAAACLLIARKILLFSFGLLLASSSLLSWVAFSGPRRGLPVFVSMGSFFLFL